MAITIIEVDYERYPRERKSSIKNSETTQSAINMSSTVHPPLGFSLPEQPSAQNTEVSSENRLSETPTLINPVMSQQSTITRMKKLSILET